MCINEIENKVISNYNSLVVRYNKVCILNEVLENERGRDRYIDRRRKFKYNL